MNKWIKVGDGFIKISSICAITYDEDRINMFMDSGEICTVENNKSILKKLRSVLDIGSGNIILELEQFSQEW